MQGRREEELRARSWGGHWEGQQMFAVIKQIPVRPGGLGSRGELRRGEARSRAQEEGKGSHRAGCVCFHTSPTHDRSTPQHSH